MALFKLPTETDGENNPRYSFRSELEGKSYTFSLYWVGRMDRWSFDLVDANDDAVITGQVIHPNLNLLRRTAVAEKPPGLLICLPENPEGTILAPGLNDLGASYSLFYYTSDDPQLAT